MILLNKLACQYDNERVHTYVKKEYFPIKECMEICKENGVTKAVACLLKRDGCYNEAIRTYLDTLYGSIDIKAMMKELVGHIDKNAMIIPEKTWEFVP